jgi:hypothetical protein
MNRIRNFLKLKVKTTAHQRLINYSLGQELRIPFVPITLFPKARLGVSQYYYSIIPDKFSSLNSKK